MMKYSVTLILSLALVMSAPARAMTDPAALLKLETAIAYQQGQFGALYAHCGDSADRVVIGGSLEAWKRETFRGYMGSPSDRAMLESSFDRAVQEVNADSNSCKDWPTQAAAAMHGADVLSRFGFPASIHQ